MRDMDEDNLLDLLLSHFNVLSKIPWKEILLVTLGLAGIQVLIIMVPIWLWCIGYYIKHYKKFGKKIAGSIFLPFWLTWKIAKWLTVYLELRDPQAKKRTTEAEDMELRRHIQRNTQNMEGGIENSGFDPDG